MFSSIEGLKVVHVKTKKGIKRNSPKTSFENNFVPCNDILIIIHCKFSNRSKF